MASEVPSYMPVFEDIVIIWRNQTCPVYGSGDFFKEPAYEARDARLDSFMPSTEPEPQSLEDVSGPSGWFLFPKVNINLHRPSRKRKVPFFIVINVWKLRFGKLKAESLESQRPEFINGSIYHFLALWPKRKYVNSEHLYFLKF